MGFGLTVPLCIAEGEVDEVEPRGIKVKKVIGIALFALGVAQLPLLFCMAAFLIWAHLERTFLGFGLQGYAPVAVFVASSMCIAAGLYLIGR
jgi:hypothetical protein